MGGDNLNKKTLKIITADKKERINKLSEILCEFLPLNSNSNNAVTFNSIFKASSVDKYLKGYKTKKQALQNGFEKIYRYNVRLPKLIIRKIVPAAIEYRKFKRNPLNRVELDELIMCLFDLGIDMKDELNKITIDETLPRITVPPKKLQENLCQHDLTSYISSEPLRLFCDGHYNEAIRKALEKFENIVKGISAIDASGRDLMGKAFSNEKHICIQDIEPENRHDFIEGYKFLAMGSMAAIRNIFSHGDEKRRSPEESYEMLLFVNWLFRFINDSDSKEI